MLFSFEVPMLFLSRKIGESIIIDDHISLTIQEIKGNSVKIGFEYPKETRILRKEIFEKIQQENKAAAAASNHITTFLQGTAAIDAPPEDF
jgi:carbon storage regulator